MCRKYVPTATNMYVLYIYGVSFSVVNIYLLPYAQVLPENLKSAIINH